MAAVVESTSTNSATSSTTVVITKPTGLAVGDMMISAVSAQGGSVTVNTLAGWTSANNETYTNGATRIQYKVADSGDVAASNFTFTSDFSANLIGGSIMRVSGLPATSPVDNSDSQNYNSTDTATISFSTSLAVSNNGFLIVMALAAHQAASNVGSIGTYVIGGSSPTWTELHEISLDSGTTDPIFGAAYAIQSTAATISSYGATLSEGREIHGGVIVVFKAIINATGTNDLLSVSPAFFAPTASASSVGTNDLLQVSPTLNSQSGRATSPTIWTNPDKSIATWDNPDK